MKNCTACNTCCTYMLIDLPSNAMYALIICSSLAVVISYQSLKLAFRYRHTRLISRSYMHKNGILSSFQVLPCMHLVHWYHQVADGEKDPDLIIPIKTIIQTPGSFQFRPSNSPNFWDHPKISVFLQGNEEKRGLPWSSLLMLLTLALQMNHHIS